MFIREWTTPWRVVHHTNLCSTSNEHIGEDPCTLKSTHRSSSTTTPPQTMIFPTREDHVQLWPRIFRSTNLHLLYKVHNPNRSRLSLNRQLHSSHCCHCTHSEPNTYSPLQVPVQVVHVLNCHWSYDQVYVQLYTRGSRTAVRPTWQVTSYLSAQGKPV
jgi:hypothetical protein